MIVYYCRTKGWTTDSYELAKSWFRNGYVVVTYNFAYNPCKIYKW